MRSPFFIRVVGRDHSLPAVARARRARFRALSVSFVILVATVFPASANPVIIGSKKFTESYVLGEIARRALNDAGVATEHRQGMGGTIILWQALQGGQIDAIGNVLALGGDRPVGIAYDKARDSFQHAIDLVKFIRRFNESGAHPDRRGFGIGVAGFPEGHPATPNRLLEMDPFQPKIEPRANYLVTQQFFDNRASFDFP